MEVGRLVAANGTTVNDTGSYSLTPEEKFKHFLASSHGRTILLISLVLAVVAFLIAALGGEIQRILSAPHGSRRITMTDESTLRTYFKKMKVKKTNQQQVYSKIADVPCPPEQVAEDTEAENEQLVAENQPS